MSKYRHIRNILVALMAAFAAVVLFIILLPYIIAVVMLLVAAVIAWQLGSYVFALAFLKLASFRR